MSDPDNWIDTAIQRAQELGKEHGSNAASWWIQEHLTKNSEARHTAHAVLAMDEAGDPALELPHADLSGEWADGMTPRKLYAELYDGHAPEEDDESIGADQVGHRVTEACDAYEQSFSDAARDECLDACRNELAS